MAAGRKGQQTEAIEHLTTAVSWDPSYLEARAELGVLYARTGEIAKALEQFERGSELEPNSGALHFNQAWALLSLGRASEAEREARRALAFNPQQVNAQRLLALALFAQVGARAQVKSADGIKTLMQEPLGYPSEPKMVLSILNVAPGVTIPSHSHAGAVFAYVLRGDIENQVERPTLPMVYHAGDFFRERPMQVHRLLRNLSETEPAKILIFQNTAKDAPGALREEPLASTTHQEVSVITLEMPPGAASAGAHQHPGPVFAYILKGEIENQVDPDPPKVYRAGDVFYEPPLHAHRFTRNLSKTEPAELLIFQVGEKGQPRVMSVEENQ